MHMHARWALITISYRTSDPMWQMAVLSSNTSAKAGKNISPSWVVAVPTSTPGVDDDMLLCHSCII